MKKLLFILSLCLSVNAYASTRVLWTGQSYYTSDYSGLMCEYKYFGQSYWVLTQSFCKQAIYIQR